MDEQPRWTPTTEEAYRRLATRIVFAPPDVQFLFKHKVAFQRPLNDLQRVYLVQTGPVALGGEYDFTVLAFSEVLWLVPNLSPLPFAFGPWSRQLQKQNGYCEVTLDELPKSWQKRLFGFSSLYRPRATEVPIGTLPVWSSQRSLPVGKVSPG